MAVQWYLPHESDSFTVSSPVQSIAAIDITYTAVATSDIISNNTGNPDNTTSSVLAYNFYRIQKIGDDYFASTGDHVDPELIREVSESFADLYKVGYQKSYNAYSRRDSGLHFTLEITLLNGRTVRAESESSYYCFIPWNVSYEGSNYVQYNGMIPSTLFKILTTLDRDQWAPYQKVATWGCYPARVPVSTQEKGISLDFPSANTPPPAEELLGKTHLQWLLTLPEIPVCTPVYYNQKVFLPFADRIECIDAQSRAQLYTIPFEVVQQPYLPVQDQKIAVSDNTLYVGAPDSHIYSIDTDTGDIRWAYKIPPVTDYIPVTLVDDKVIALTGGIVCLEKEHGDVLWEIASDTWNETVYNDTILFAYLQDLSQPHYIVLDIATVEPLWGRPLHTVQHPFYSQGTLYFFNEEGTLTKVALEQMAETDLFQPSQPVESMSILGDRIVLVLKDESGIQSVLMVHTDGVRTWEHTLERNDYPISRMILSEQRVFLIREAGIIQALDVETGEELWIREVRGTTVTSFHEYKENICVSADDGYIYCLSAETGFITWYFMAQNELEIFPDKISLSVTSSEGYLLVVTPSGVLYLLSLS
ncbi:MAG: PQQ-binding-like beta-propeller repeat protein [Theionarchaea archaeon]|nr:PQQ-binding-like beta-propeller repeat protein [Theionarchaea archaeon]MBU7038607.1 PQQ-binding-like beta-propeller repeat protein [Theionarchaea archaeon]